MENNLDWAGFFTTMVHKVRACESEEQMYQQLKKFKEEFNSEYGRLSRKKRSKDGYEGD